MDYFVPATGRLADTGNIGVQTPRNVRSPGATGRQLRQTWAAKTIAWDQAYQAAPKHAGPAIAQAEADAVAETGEALTAKDRAAVMHEVAGQLMPGYRPAAEAAVAAGSGQAKANAIARKWLPDIAKKFNPFKPADLRAKIAAGKEFLLWEDRDIIVIGNWFNDHSDALVLPKRAMSVPTEANDRLLEKIAKAANACAQALQTVTPRAPRAPVDIRINPPHILSVSQMHCHVDTKLDVTADPKKPREVAAVSKIFAAAAQEMSKLMGPTSQS